MKKKKKNEKEIYKESKKWNDRNDNCVKCFTNF